MSSTLGAVISFLAAFQMLFVSIYLYSHKKGNRRNNGLLGTIFLLFSISLTDFTARVSGHTFSIPLLHLIDDGFFFLYGPLLYLYTKCVVYKNFRARLNMLPHLLPYILYTSVIAYQFGFASKMDQAELTERIVTSQLPAWVIVATLAIYGHILIYLWFSWKTIRQYQAEIKNRFSNTEKINLNWLSFIIKAFGLITVIAMVHNSIPVFGDLSFYYASIILLLVSSFVFVNKVLVKALNQPEIFSGLEEVEKYASSSLTSEEINKHRDQLIRLMKEEKEFLNPELTSKDLANRLAISAKTLSQVINQSFGKNFFDFVNSYRCEEVMEILGNEGSEFTIIEAMYKSGFNSKSSFNKEFKKLTGKTPTEFKRQLKN